MLLRVTVRIKEMSIYVFEHSNIESSNCHVIMCHTDIVKFIAKTSYELQNTKE